MTTVNGIAMIEALSDSRRRYAPRDALRSLTACFDPLDAPTLADGESSPCSAPGRLAAVVYLRLSASGRALISFKFFAWTLRDLSPADTRHSAVFYAFIYVSSEDCRHGRGSETPRARMLGRVSSIDGPFDRQPSCGSFPALALISALMRLLNQRGSWRSINDSRGNEPRLVRCHSFNCQFHVSVLGENRRPGLGDMFPGVRVARSVEEASVGLDARFHRLAHRRQDLLEEYFSG